MVQLMLSVNSEHIELIKLTTRALGDYSQYDELCIYELQDKFEIITKCHTKKYTTRTYIGKYRWRVLNAYYKAFEEEEVEIFLRKQK